MLPAVVRLLVMFYPTQYLLTFVCSSWLPFGSSMALVHRRDGDLSFISAMLHYGGLPRLVG